MTVRKKITTSEFISEVVEKTKEPEAKLDPETLPVSEQPEPKPEVIPEPETLLEDTPGNVVLTIPDAFAVLLNTAETYFILYVPL